MLWTWSICPRMNLSPSWLGAAVRRIEGSKAGSSTKTFILPVWLGGCSYWYSSTVRHDWISDWIDSLSAREPTSTCRTMCCVIRHNPVIQVELSGDPAGCCNVTEMPSHVHLLHGSSQYDKGSGNFSVPDYWVWNFSPLLPIWVVSQTVLNLTLRAKTTQETKGKMS